MPQGGHRTRHSQEPQDSAPGRGETLHSALFEPQLSICTQRHQRRTCCRQHQADCALRLCWHCQAQALFNAHATAEPPLLLQATAALDVRSERAVQAALDELMTQRTCVIVAHRLSTIQQASTICGAPLMLPLMQLCLCGFKQALSLQLVQLQFVQMLSAAQLMDLGDVAGPAA